MLVIIFLSLSIFAQTPSLEVEGSISIGNDANPSPAPGTIRFTGSDFQGWDGTKWISLSIGNVIEHSTDGSGNSYPSLQIGSQVWMAKNLNTKHLNDGTPIPIDTSSISWGTLTSPAMCYYQNGESENAQTYGALYNWPAVESGKLCPSGWKVPSLDDWAILFNYLGTTTAAGGSMKEAGFEHWQTPNVGATNSSEFTGLPGGYRHNNGSFNSLTMFGYWWTSTPDPNVADNANYHSLNFGGAGVTTFSRPKVWGLSIRCVRE